MLQRAEIEKLFPRDGEHFDVIVAGVAAALSAKEGAYPRDLDIRKLQRRLRDMNVPI